MRNSAPTICPFASFWVMLLLFNCQVMSDSLWPHGLWHARLPCSSLSPGVCLNSCPLGRWCYLTISSSATPFSFWLPSFVATGFFPMSQFFMSGGQSIGASASATDLLMNIQGRFPLGLTGLISLQGTLKILLQHHNLKALCYLLYTVGSA